MRSPERARGTRAKIRMSRRNAQSTASGAPVRRGARRCTSERRHPPSACPIARPARARRSKTSEGAETTGTRRAEATGTLPLPPRVATQSRDTREAPACESGRVAEPRGIQRAAPFVRRCAESRRHHSCTHTIASHHSLPRGGKGKGPQQSGGQTPTSTIEAASLVLICSPETSARYPRKTWMSRRSTRGAASGAPCRAECGTLC